MLDRIEDYISEELEKEFGLWLSDFIMQNIEEYI
jgi:hypothetical protein